VAPGGDALVLQFLESVVSFGRSARFGFRRHAIMREGALLAALGQEKDAARRGRLLRLLGRPRQARAALNEAQLRVQLVSPPRPCPVKTLGAMSQSLQRSRDAILREHLQARSEELKQVQPNAQKFQLFIFGHTHEAQSPFEPMSGLSRWQPIVINTGAWQRVISPEALERWRGARPASVVLSALPEALPPCYSVVVVEPYQVSPKASLRYWTNRDGRWQFADSCRWTPPAK